jgi:SAM-dependent methyltransferase
MVYDEKLWDEYKNHLRKNNIFSLLENKNVLDIATGDGNIWEVIRENNPKTLTGLDPDPRWYYADNNISKDDIISQTYENFLPTHGYDAIVCFGLIYKLSSPIRLLELIARSQPEVIILEDLNLFNEKDKVTTWDILKSKQNRGDLIYDDDINSGIIIGVTFEMVTESMNNMGYSYVSSSIFKIRNEDHSKYNTRQYVFTKKIKRR